MLSLRFEDTNNIFQKTSIIIGKKSAGNQEDCSGKKSCQNLKTTMYIQFIARNSPISQKIIQNQVDLLSGYRIICFFGPPKSY